MRPDPWANLGVVNASHAPPPCHTPAALGAPDEEEVPLRTTPPRGEHAAERLSRTLLERIRDTRTREDRRPSLDVDAQTHQTAKQDVQAASASLLLGGGKEDAEHEQRAGCCARHPLDFQHTLATPHRHACRFGGHTPHAQPHAHAHTQPLVHRARLSVWESGAPPLISRPACKPLGPSRKTQTKQGE